MVRSQRRPGAYSGPPARHRNPSEYEPGQRENPGHRRGLAPAESSQHFQIPFEAVAGSSEPKTPVTRSHPVRNAAARIPRSM